MHPPYSGHTTFLGVEPGRRDGARFSILGIPFDGAVTNRPGQRFGPRLIRAASIMLTQEEHPVLMRAPAKVLQDLGDMNIPISSVHSYHEKIEQEMRVLLIDQGLINRGVEPIILGGDHSITLPILKALNPVVGGPIALIHLDAHHDNWDQVFGDHDNHGTWLHQAIVNKLVDPNLLYQIGIRSPSDPKINMNLPARGATVFTARQAMKMDPAAAAANIKTKLGDRPVWLTLDIDCLDPAYAPGVGTPEVGGLSTLWLMEFIERLDRLNFIGMDMVEVADNDVNQITALAAATAVWTYMSMRMAS